MATATSRAPRDALKDFDVLPDAAYVRERVVCGLFTCSSSTVWRRTRDGRIPKPHKLSDGVTGWNVGELRLALAAARTSTPASAPAPKTGTVTTKKSRAKPKGTARKTRK